MFHTEREMTINSNQSVSHQVIYFALELLSLNSSPQGEELKVEEEWEDAWNGIKNTWIYYLFNAKPPWTFSLTWTKKTPLLKNYCCCLGKILYDVDTLVALMMFIAECDINAFSSIHIISSVYDFRYGTSSKGTDTARTRVRSPVMK